MATEQTPLLHVENLGVAFSTDEHNFNAVSGVSFDIHAGEIFCLVGESGCGKSLTAKALLRLIPENASVMGKAFLQGESILDLTQQSMRKIRGHGVGMIFQEPMTALNPVLRVGHQVMEPLILHLGLTSKEAERRCLELFRQVGIPAPESRINDYPHQLSGGMRQRVMIAMALACHPLLLLADEPTTALDVTIQWQILHLIQGLAQDRGMGVLLITHDLGVVAQVAQRVGVMYAGQMVEQGTVEEVLQHSLHPYTQGLLHSAPGRHSMDLYRLPVIKGMVPLPYALPRGCRFHPRCQQAMARCQQEEPPLLTATADGHQVRCWLNV